MDWIEGGRTTPFSSCYNMTSVSLLMHWSTCFHDFRFTEAQEHWLSVILYLGRTHSSADTDISFSVGLTPSLSMWLWWTVKSVSQCWFMELVWKLVEGWKLEDAGDFVVVVLVFFSSLQREACLTSEIGGISIQKTLVPPLFLINLVMHHKYVKLCYFDLNSHRKI